MFLYRLAELESLIGADHWIVSDLKQKQQKLSTTPSDTYSHILQPSKEFMHLLDTAEIGQELPGQALIDKALVYLETYDQTSYCVSTHHPWLIRFGMEITASSSSSTVTAANSITSPPMSSASVVKGGSAGGSVSSSHSQASHLRPHSAAVKPRGSV